MFYLHLYVGILNTEKMPKSLALRESHVFYPLPISYNITYILYGYDQGRLQQLRHSEQLYSRLTELDQVLISGVGGQASDVEVCLAQLIPS